MLGCAALLWWSPCGRFCRGAGVCGPWWLSLFLPRAVPLFSLCLSVLVWAGLFRSFLSLPVLSSCVAGWLRRRSVFQESAFLGYVPFGTWRVTVSAGPCGSSQRHGVPGGLRRAGPSGGLPWVVRLFLCRLRPVPARSAVHRLRCGLFAPAPVVWSCKLLSPPPCSAAVRALLELEARLVFPFGVCWWFGFSCRFRLSGLKIQTVWSCARVSAGMCEHISSLQMLLRKAWSLT